MLRACLFALSFGCGARTELRGDTLGSTPPTTNPDSGTIVPVTCHATKTTAIGQGTANDDALRVDDAFVVWNDGARIVRAPKNGGATAVVVDTVVDAFDVSPTGVVYVAANDSFVKNANGTEPHPSRVVAVDLASGDTTTLVATPLSLPGSLLGIDSQYVYYATSFGVTGLSIERVDQSGATGASNVTSSATYCAACNQTLLAIDDTNVYYSAGELGEKLVEAPKSGNAAVVLATSASSAALTSIAADGACVYWTATDDPNVYATPR